MNYNLYHKRFFEKFSSENVIALFSRYKGAFKEITESWGLFEAAKKYVPNLSKFKVIIVGDGCSPRTGAIFAYNTKAEVISIDPEFNLTHWNEHCKKQLDMGFPIQNLIVIKDKIENIVIDCENKNCLVIWPHSHANMNNTNIVNFIKRIDIAMPCCKPIPNSFLNVPHLCFRDNNIISPKNTIHIWGV